MTVFLLTVRLYAPWVHSLKEKRMLRNSLIAKLQNKFHLSVIESAEQDTHQILVISVAALTAHSSQADSMMDHILDFISGNSEAEIIECTREFR